MNLENVHDKAHHDDKGKWVLPLNMLDPVVGLV